MAPPRSRPVPPPGPHGGDRRAYRRFGVMVLIVNLCKMITQMRLFWTAKDFYRIRFDGNRP
jgi:hypothetical protein